MSMLYLDLFISQIGIIGRNSFSSLPLQINKTIINHMVKSKH